MGVITSNKHYAIPNIPHESLNLDGVSEDLVKFGFSSPIETDRAISYGRKVIDIFTPALDRKLMNRAAYPVLQFADSRNVFDPVVKWGVVGVNQAAGTLAAMHALRDHTEVAGYDCEITSSDLEIHHERIDRVWFRLAITNSPSIQS